MKTVGILCAKDEADLLPQTLPHIRDNVDYIYAYDDNSKDATWSLIKDKVDYAKRGAEDPDRKNHNRGNYHHLLEQIKKDFKNEEVWIVITMADRFFLNKTPRQIVEEAGSYEAVEGVQLDFLRPRWDPWTLENDPFPDMSNIRHLCRWFKFDEQCVVAYKLHKDLTYIKAKYPWPRGIIGDRQYSPGLMNNKISLDMPFLEHPGRRTPLHCVWKYKTGSRPRSRKRTEAEDDSTFEAVMETLGNFYAPYRVLPWVDLSSLEKVVELYNESNWKDRTNLRYFFWGIEYMAKKFPPPPRTDI